MSHYNNDPLFEAVVNYLSKPKETPTMQKYHQEWINESPENSSGKPEFQKHYQGLIQPIEIMRDLLSSEEFIGFCKGNMIKYAYRAGRKEGESGIKDKEKYEAYKGFLEAYSAGEPLLPKGDKGEDN